MMRLKRPLHNLLRSPHTALRGALHGLGLQAQPGFAARSMLRETPLRLHVLHVHSAFCAPCALSSGCSLRLCKGLFNWILSIVLGFSHTAVLAASVENTSASRQEDFFEKLASQCAPEIHPHTLRSLIKTESSFNPFAIGVVGGRLTRQPTNLTEAIATAEMLEKQGFNYSLGLAQINRANVPKQKETLSTIFDPCRNLSAGSAILKDCYLRAKKKIYGEQEALRAALSCYYSGNFKRGLQADKVGQASYVQKVVAHSPDHKPTPIVPAIKWQQTDAISNVSQRPHQSRRDNVDKTWVIFTEHPRPSLPDKQNSSKNGMISKIVQEHSRPTAVNTHAVSLEQASMPFVQVISEAGP